MWRRVVARITTVLAVVTGAVLVESPAWAGSDAATAGAASVAGFGVVGVIAGVAVLALVFGVVWSTQRADGATTHPRTAERGSESTETPANDSRRAHDRVADLRSGLAAWRDTLDALQASEGAQGLAWLLARFTWMLDELEFVLAQISDAVAMDLESDHARRLADRAVDLLVVLGAYRDAAVTFAAGHGIALPEPGLLDPLDVRLLRGVDAAGPLALVVLQQRGLPDWSPRAHAQTLGDILTVDQLDSLNRVNAWRRHQTGLVLLALARQLASPVQPGTHRGLPSELRDVAPLTPRQAHELSARWWEQVKDDPNLREAVARMNLNYEINYDLQEYLQFLTRRHGATPIPDGMLDELAVQIGAALDLAGRGPVQRVYRGVRWDNLVVLPSDPAAAAAIAADHRAPISPFTPGDVLEAATFEFVTYDLADAQSYARMNQLDEPMRIVFEYLTTDPVWLTAVDLREEAAARFGDEDALEFDAEGLRPLRHRNEVVAVTSAPFPGIDFLVTAVQEDLLPEVRQNNEKGSASAGDSSAGSGITSSAVLPVGLLGWLAAVNPGELPHAVQAGLGVAIALGVAALAVKALVGGKTTRAPPFVGSVVRNGGPARISGEDLTASQRRAIAPLLDPASAVGILGPEQVAELFGLPVGEVLDAGCPLGSCVIADFHGQANRLTADAHPDAVGVDDLVIYADAVSGYLFTGPEVVDAVRSGVLDNLLLGHQRLGRHELDELRNAGRPVDQRVPHHRLVPLPDLSLMWDVLPTTRGRASAERVSVYHGSVAHATEIAEWGLVPERLPTWISRDLHAAENAIGDHRSDLKPDPGIVESRVPREEFDRLFAPSERGYRGFNRSLWPTTEIVLETWEQVQLFNMYVVRAPADGERSEASEQDRVDGHGSSRSNRLRGRLGGVVGWLRGQLGIVVVGVVSALLAGVTDEPSALASLLPLAATVRGPGSASGGVGLSGAGWFGTVLAAGRAAMASVVGKALAAWAFALARGPPVVDRLLRAVWDWVTKLWWWATAGRLRTSALIVGVALVFAVVAGDGVSVGTGGVAMGMVWWPGRNGPANPDAFAVVRDSHERRILQAPSLGRRRLAVLDSLVEVDQGVGVIVGRRAGLRRALRHAIRRQARAVRSVPAADAARGGCCEMRVQPFDDSGERSRRSDLLEFDFLIVREPGLVEYVSAKVDPAELRANRDRRKLAHLFDEMPVEDRTELQRYLQQRRNYRPTRAATVVEIRVIWDGAVDWMPLGEFRRQYVKGISPDAIDIDLVTVADGGTDLHIGLSRAELAAEVRLGIERLITALDDAERYGGGQPGDGSAELEAEHRADEANGTDGADTSSGSFGSAGGGSGSAAPASASDSVDGAATESAADRAADERLQEMRTHAPRGPPSWLRRIVAWFVTALTTVVGAVLIGSPVWAGSSAAISAVGPSAAGTIPVSDPMQEAGYGAVLGDAAQAFVEAGPVVWAVVAGALVVRWLLTVGRWPGRDLLRPSAFERVAGAVSDTVVPVAQALAARGHAVRDGWPIEWSAWFWAAALRAPAVRLWHNTKLVAEFAFTPAGAAYIAVGAVFVVATGASMIWALPAISAMAAFQVRGSLNTVKHLLSADVWVQRGLLAAIVATLSVNIPHHIRGMLNAAAPDANQWISGLFGVAAATTVIGAIAMLGALLAAPNPATGAFAKWWNRFADRAATIGAAATLLAIPFMVYAVLAHPGYDGVVSSHPVVFALVVATFTGFGGEALLHLIGEVFHRSLPSKLTGFFRVYSAATIAVYGMLYQLHHVPVLIAVTAALALAGLLHWVLTRPYLTRVGKTAHAVTATALTLVNTAAATALFLGWPAIATAAGITVATGGLAVTATWIWSALAADPVRVLPEVGELAVRVWMWPVRVMSGWTRAVTDLRAQFGRMRPRGHKSGSLVRLIRGGLRGLVGARWRSAALAAGRTAVIAPVMWAEARVHVARVLRWLGDAVLRTLRWVDRAWARAPPWVRGVVRITVIGAVLLAIFATRSTTAAEMATDATALSGLAAAAMVPPIGRARGKPDHLLAVGNTGEIVRITDPTLIGAVEDTVNALERADQRAVTMAPDQTDIASPGGKWRSNRYWFFLAEDLNTALSHTLDERGLEPITVVYFLQWGRRRVVADRALFREIGMRDLDIRMALEDALLAPVHQIADEIGEVDLVGAGRILATGDRIAKHYRKTVVAATESWSALTDYADSGYFRLNHWLRTGDANNPAYLTRMTRWLDALIVRYRLQEELTVRRSFRKDSSGGPFPRGPLERGTMLTDHGYVSTTYGIEQDLPIRFEITVPAGMNVIVVAGVITSYRESKEILLPRGTRFLIESDTMDGEIRRIKATALPPVDTSLPWPGKFADPLAAVVEPPTKTNRDPGEQADASETEGPHSGAVIKGHWWKWQRASWGRLLPRLAELGTQYPAGSVEPGAPAVLEIPLDWRVRAWLAVTGNRSLRWRLVGYYWVERDVVVVFTPTLARLRAAGLLERLLQHEHDFHREGLARNDTGLLHDEDAAEIIDLLGDDVLDGRDFRLLWWGRMVGDGGSASAGLLVMLHGDVPSASGAAHRIAAAGAAVMLAGGLVLGTPAAAQAISHGREVDSEPWVVEIGFGGTGSLIAPDWVLTARHVVTNDDGSPSDPESALGVRVGHSEGVEGDWLDIDRIHVHEEADLALLHLADPADLTPAMEIEYARIAAEDPAIGAQVTSYGWGLTEDSAPPGTVKAADARVLASYPIQDLSDGSADYFSGMPGHGLSVKGIDGNTEPGDSGGPVMIESADGGQVQVGVVSGGVPGSGSPDLFVSTASYREWIAETTGTTDVLAPAPDTAGLGRWLWPAVPALLGWLLVVAADRWTRSTTRLRGVAAAVRSRTAGVRGIFAPLAVESLVAGAALAMFGLQGPMLVVGSVVVAGLGRAFAQFVPVSRLGRGVATASLAAHTALLGVGIVEVWHTIGRLARHVPWTQWWSWPADLITGVLVLWARAIHLLPTEITSLPGAWLWEVLYALPVIAGYGYLSVWHGVADTWWVRKAAAPWHGWQKTTHYNPRGIALAAILLAPLAVPVAPFAPGALVVVGLPLLAIIEIKGAHSRARMGLRAPVPGRRTTAVALSVS